MEKSNPGLRVYVQSRGHIEQVAALWLSVNLNHEETHNLDHDPIITMIMIMITY